MTFNNNIHIGIVSWGRGCALKGYPGVYAQTDAFLDFISENSGPFVKSKDIFLNPCYGSNFGRFLCLERCMFQQYLNCCVRHYFQLSLLR